VPLMQGCWMRVQSAKDQRRAALARVRLRLSKIVDVKCPDSGEGDTFCMENLEGLTPQDEIKFVLSSRADYDFAREFARCTIWPSG